MISHPARSLAGLVVCLPLLLGLGACGSGDVAHKSTPSAPSATSPAATLISAGLRALKEGHNDVATASFTAALEVDPTNVYANYNLGYLAQTAGKTTKALTYYDAALASDKAFAPALYNKALLLETSDLDAAITLYREAIASAPDNAAAHMRLGFALIHQGKTPEGEKELGTGITLDPSMKNVAAPNYGD